MRSSVRGWRQLPRGRLGIALIAVFGSAGVHGGLLLASSILARTFAGPTALDPNTTDAELIVLKAGVASVPPPTMRRSAVPTEAQAPQSPVSLADVTVSTPDSTVSEKIDTASAPTTDQPADVFEKASPAGSVEFAGANASSIRSVVYVVDASGPMVSSLTLVLDEVRRSVEILSTAQEFSVVLFRRLESRGGEVGLAAGVEIFPPVLMRPTDSVKRRLETYFADVRPVGKSDPLAGLEAALALKPDVVFLLSRSIERSGGGVWGLGKEAILARLDQLNPREAPSHRRATMIRTIQFLDEDPTGIMQAIAESHGGGSITDRRYVVLKNSDDLQRHEP